MTTVKAYAARERGAQLEPFEFDAGPLGDEDVEIDVKFCGICQSDVSMIDDEWEISAYPLVPGHEIVGTIAAVGSRVKKLAIGQWVGVGWLTQSCMSCDFCLSGNHNLCQGLEMTIVGRHGGFASQVRAHAAWAIPIPEGLDPKVAGPLFCGGITVFNPLEQLGIKPTDRVGVIGIGGLGHMAIRFLRAWGCEVTAFSGSPDKEAEAKQLGAHRFVNGRDKDAIAALESSLHYLLSTANANLNWDAYISTLRPGGRLHLLGIPPNPTLSFSSLPLIDTQKAVSGSPVGSQMAMARMLDFAARHGIEPMVEMYPFSQINEAIARLREGKPRYRIVLHH